MSHLPSLLALLPLDKLPRTGWILAGVPDPESVGGHLLSTAYVALSIAPEVDPPLDLSRVLAMALVHDAPETATGDLPRAAAQRLPAGAKAEMERAVADRLLPGLSGAARDAFHEYQAGETREARFVHLCDKVQLGIRLAGYLQAGTRGLESFLGSVRELDGSEFPPLAALHADVLAAIDGALR